MGSVSVTWSHCSKKSWKHEIIKTINSCGYSTSYNTDHFSCSCEQIGNPEAEGGNDVTWGTTEKSENKKSGTLGSAGEIVRFVGGGAKRRRTFQTTLVLCFAYVSRRTKSKRG